MFFSILILVVGFVVLIKGADWLVAGASAIAKSYGISELVIGLTVVALGTSMPELVVSLFSAIEGKTDIAMGNIVGSNNFNLLAILGIAGLIYPIQIHYKTVKNEIPFSLLAAILVLIFCNSGALSADGLQQINRIEGLVLIACFIGFMVYAFKTSKDVSESVNNEESIETLTKKKSLIFILLGLAGLVIGGKLVVDSAIEIAKEFGMSEKLIGLTIVAAGTSLPELATSAVAAFKKKSDIAIGNVIGSNIFNIFFILGLSSIIHPIPLKDSYNFDLYILIGSTVVLMAFVFIHNRYKLDRWQAGLLLVGFVSYLTYMIAG